MRTLGSVEISGADTSFQTEPPKPALPGSKATFVESGGRRPRLSREEDSLESESDSRMAAALDSARAHAQSTPSSTTMAALAQMLDAAGEKESANQAAKEALQLASKTVEGHLLDPTAVRISLEVLIRLGESEKAIALARELPIGSYTSLMIAAVLATSGRFPEARELLGHVDGTGKDAISAFMFISEGNFTAAVPLLRAALRRAPDDADSAHNLSIALWQLGSRRKARLAALQATRSAPGRQDISQHYLELLLADGENEHAEKEIEQLLDRGVVPTARLLITRARAQLGLNNFPKAERLLTRAGDLARADGDAGIVAEVLSNLARLGFVHGKHSRDEAITKLLELHHEYPSSDVVVVNLGQVSVYKHQAKALRSAFDDVRAIAPQARIAFLEYQLASLEGDNKLAAEHASVWLELEPANPYAASAALVALGIGMERWGEAAAIALRQANGTPDAAEINNAAYVLAMAGLAPRAIELLEGCPVDDFVLTATLGLSYLAANQVDRGMKLYRQAAEASDARGDDVRCLMTAYQALVVRQLGLLKSTDATMISAISLPPVELPDDWEDRPEFLRLHDVALRNGFGWPLSI